MIRKEKREFEVELLGVVVCECVMQQRATI